jgi:hypothetical protein
VNQFQAAQKVFAVRLLESANRALLPAEGDQEDNARDCEDPAVTYIKLLYW